MKCDDDDVKHMQHIDKTAHKLTNQTNKQTKQINKNRPVAFNC